MDMDTKVDTQVGMAKTHGHTHGLRYKHSEINVLTNTDVWLNLDHR